MRLAALLTALCVGLIGSAAAQDTASQAVIDRMKAGKLMPISDVAVLMMGAERWCYRLQDGNCAWSDIYLAVSQTDAIYEISNPWSEEIDISFVDRGVFRQDRYVCETGNDWVPTVRGYERADGTAIEGRALAALREEIYSMVSVEDDDDCFDYLYQHHNKAEETVTLLQRHYVEGETDPANDTLVTLYFNADAAADLGWYW